eukprot:4810504-Pyramimonas_sp.AAC.1
MTTVRFFSRFAQRILMWGPSVGAIVGLVELSSRLVTVAWCASASFQVVGLGFVFGSASFRAWCRRLAPAHPSPHPVRGYVRGGTGSWGGDIHPESAIHRR